VVAQPGLAIVASSVSHPDDVAVVSRFIQLQQYMGLPGAGFKSRVVGQVHQATQSEVPQSSIVPGSNSGVQAFEVGHGLARVLLDGVDHVVEGRSSLLALTSTGAEFKGSSNAGLLLMAVGDSLLLGAASLLESHSGEQGVKFLNCAEAHGLVHLDVSLPMDSASGRCALHLEGQVLDVLREVVLELISRAEGSVLVSEVQSENVVARHVRC